MTTLDDIAPAFRSAARRWPEAMNLQRHYADLAATFVANGSSLVELCKSFIETVCVTLLNEFGKAPTTETPTTKLLVDALSELGLKNTRGASAFDKVLSAYNKLADALNDLRNQEGTVAHGKDGFIDALSERHARVYVLSADMIVALLLLAYNGIDPHLLHTREPYGRFRHLDNRIDGASGLEAEVDDDGILVVRVSAGSLTEAFDLRVPVSQLLYCLDRQAYVDVLEALQGVTIEETEEEPVVTDVEPLPKLPPEPETAEPSDVPEPLEEYRGRFVAQVNLLYEHLYHVVLNGKPEKADAIQRWTYTLLAGMEELAVVDWATRDSAKAKVRLLVKRTAKLFDLGIENDEPSIQNVIMWLAANITGEPQAAS